MVAQKFGWGKGGALWGGGMLGWLLLIAAAAAQAQESSDDAAAPEPEPPMFLPLFPKAQYEGWTFGDWSDVARPQQNDGAPWKLEDDMLTGLGKRTWIFSGVEYGDFILRCEWRISPGAEGGIGLRFAGAGDPAQTGLELQLVDEKKYYGNKVPPEKTTGAIYDEAPPLGRAAKPPGEWNALEIDLQGSKLKVTLNDAVVQDLDLARRTSARRAGRSPLAERETSGRLGFQNTKGTIQFRKLWIKDLDPVTKKTDAPQAE